MTSFRDGSRWRRWDLQVHTPFSVLNNQFKCDFKTYAKELLSRTIAKRVAVVGVTDYFVIDGYKQLRALLADQEWMNASFNHDQRAAIAQITFLPNIELRLDNFAGKNKRVNFHVIFSDDVAPDYIQENFLNEIHFMFQADQPRALTRSNLMDFGRFLQSPPEEISDEKAFLEGCKQAALSVVEVSEKLRKAFQGQYVLALAEEGLGNLKWEGQDKGIRTHLVQVANCLIASNKQTVKWALGKLEQGEGEFIRRFAKLKPCFSTSDPHTLDEIYEKNNERACWIKADPTFRGLLHVLAEPEQRVLLAAEDPWKVRLEDQATNIITSLTLQRSGDAPAHQKWFSDDIPLSPGLVAIIGRKGAGKSALVDIVGLVGNSSRQRDFSFLKKSKFLAGKPPLATYFKAQLKWQSYGKAEGVGLSEFVPLDADIAPGARESVKYLPQNYLETICGEHGESGASSFTQELENVIFSHVPPEDRLGCATLEEYVREVSRQQQKSILASRDKLRDLVNSLCAIEKRLEPQYRTKLEDLRAKSHRDTETHRANEPQPPKLANKSKELEGAQKLLQEKMDKLKAERAKLEAEEKTARTKTGETNARIASYKRLIEGVQNISEAVSAAKAELQPHAQVAGVNLDEVVNLTTNDELIVVKRDKDVQLLKTLREHVDPTFAGSVAERLAKLDEEMSDVEADLDEPVRAQEEYLRSHDLWKRKLDAMVGSKNSPDTLVWYDTQLKALDEGPALRESIIAQRDELVREVASKIATLVDAYKELYAPVQTAANQVSVHLSAEKGSIPLEFSAGVSANDFREGFLKFINAGRKGRFHGKEESEQFVKSLVDSASLDTADQIVEFAQNICSLLYGGRAAPFEEDDIIENQLKQPYTKQQVLEYVFGLEYLKPTYGLKWGGRSLDQLSPGERGTLLLIFYLLIDKGQEPLLLDQPEENLDNQTIYGVLVPAIRLAKERRQILMVTHNPNLAVVCDAEQVIHVDMDKTSGNKVIYTCGAIENPELNRRLVDVLEGTRPAFDKREEKYELGK
ncbi:MAG: hypothetical protein H6840_09710 [Planctomycetes bacterium]|nr:hypothetical protein [Planctomycetota bacterium]